MSEGGAVNCEIGDAECMLDPADPGNGVVDKEGVKVVTWPRPVRPFDSAASTVR